MITLIFLNSIIIIVAGIILWVIGMGITARLWDSYDEEIGFVLFCFWWIILPFIILNILFELVSGK